MAEHDVSAQLTFVELAKRTNNKEMLAIAEVLDKETPIFKDALWYEANQKTAHVITRRAALPAGTWRAANEGVDPEASQTEQIVEQIGYLESRVEVDEMIVNLAPNPKQFRWEEDLAHLEGLAQTVETAFFYGVLATEPNSINGLRTRYNLLTLDNTHDTGGAGGDTTSLFIVQWGKNGVHLVYPRNMAKQAIERNDKGKELITTAGTARFYAYVSQFIAHLGLVVRDDRCVQIVTNIELTGGANEFDEDLVIEALSNMPRNAEGAVIYMNKELKAQVDIAAKNMPNVYYTAQDAFGVPVTYFRGVPIHIAGQIINTEVAMA